MHTSKGIRVLEQHQRFEISFASEQFGEYYLFINRILWKVKQMVGDQENEVKRCWNVQLQSGGWWL